MHRQPSSLRRLVVAAALLLVVAVGCQAPDETNGQSGTTTAPGATA